MPVLRIILYRIFGVPLRWVAFFILEYILKKIAQKFQEWNEKRRREKSEAKEKEKK